MGLFRFMAALQVLLATRVGGAELGPQAKLILRIVRKRPGLRVGELQARTLLGEGSFYLHLGKLRARGLVKVRRKRAARFVFPVSEHYVIPKYVQVEEKLSGPAKRIARAIVENPGLNVGGLAALIDRPERSVYYHVKKFATARLITSSAGEGYAEIRATRKLLDDMGMQA